MTDFRIGDRVKWRAEMSTEWFGTVEDVNTWALAVLWDNDGCRSSLSPDKHIFVARGEEPDPFEVDE